MRGNLERSNDSVSEADSFISELVEREVESIPSYEEIRYFNPKDILKNNRVDENKLKLLSLQLYKRDNSKEPEIVFSLPK